MGNGVERKSKHHAPRQVNLSTSQPRSQGPWGPGAGVAGGLGKSGWCGLAWVGVLGRWRERWGRSPERFPPAPPGLTHALLARASARPSQARGSRRGRVRGFGGSHSGISGRRRRPACHTPPAESRIGNPRLAPPIALAAGRFPLEPAARPVHPHPGPGGQVPRAPAPRSLPAAVRASLQLPQPTSASAEGKGKGRGSAGTCPSCGGGRQPE